MINKASTKSFIENYLIVQIRCTNIELFLNRCITKGILIEDINKQDFTTVILKIRYNQYGLFRKIARNSGAKVKILRKYGLRFSYNRFTKRIFFALGFLLFIITILILSNLIWNINIIGANQINENKLYTVLSHEGLKKGAFKSNINLRKIEQDLIKEFDQISIAKIEYSGTRAIIRITERTMPSEIINNSTPTDIIASKPGIVNKLTVFKGIPIIKLGEYVKSGQLLVKGIVTDTESITNIYTHARANVLAKTWYETSTNANYNYKYEERTGKYKQNIYYLIGKHKLYAKKSNIDYKKYDKIEMKKVTTIGGINLPVVKVTDNYYEKTVHQKKLTPTEAYKLCVLEAKKNIQKIIPYNAKLLNVKLYKVSGINQVKVRLLYIMEENIGMERASN